MQARSAMDAVCKSAYVVLDTTAFTGLSSLWLYRVPQGTTCPYTAIQPVTETKMDCFGAPGKAVSFQVHVTSVSPGSESLTVLDKAVQLLDYSTAPAVTAHVVMDYQYEGVDTFEEEDAGITYRHAIGLFRGRVWQTS